MKKLLALVLTLSIGLNSAQLMCKAEGVPELNANKTQTQVKDEVKQKTSIQVEEAGKEKKTTRKLEKTADKGKDSQNQVKKAEQTLNTKTKIKNCVKLLWYVVDIFCNIWVIISTVKDFSHKKNEGGYKDGYEAGYEQARQEMSKKGECNFSKVEKEKKIDTQAEETADKVKDN